MCDCGRLIHDYPRDHLRAERRGQRPVVGVEGLRVGAEQPPVSKEDIGLIPMTYNSYV